MYHYGQEYFKYQYLGTSIKSLRSPRETAMKFSPLLKDITYCIGTKPMLFVTLIKKFNVWEIDPDGNKLAIYVIFCFLCQYTMCHKKVCHTESPYWINWEENWNGIGHKNKLEDRTGSNKRTKKLGRQTGTRKFWDNPIGLKT